VVGGDTLSLSLNVVEGSAGHKHSAAGHADRTARPAHDVGIRECCALRHQSVDVRCGDGVAQRADRIEPLVIGEQ